MSGTIKPWESPEESVTVLLEQWGLLNEELHNLFEKRAQKEAKPVMEKGISLFIEFLHWSNGRPEITTEIDYTGLKIKPVNIGERLNFIIARPTLFQSYMQLAELFVEQEKGFKKALAIKKLKK
ncbi:YpoC family protein [Robertmurraya sp. Marseille-Q9965]